MYNINQGCDEMLQGIVALKRSFFLFNMKKIIISLLIILFFSFRSFRFVYRCYILYVSMSVCVYYTQSS